MKFTPKSEQEIKSERCLPEGEYPFQISKAEDKISKQGNEMIELLVRVFKADGSIQLVNDYLMEKMLYKLLHCCEACGLKDKYDTGTLLASDFIGKEGMLKLTIRKSEEYGDQNQVKDYIVPKDGEVKKPLPKDALQKSLDDDLEDSIPF